MSPLIFYPKSNFGNNACVWGFPVQEGGQQADNIPLETQGLFFYEGAKIELDYLSNVLKQTAQNITHLSIGYCHYPKKDTHLRYEEILPILNDFQFPKLKMLELGVDALIANEHCVYGKLGKLTQILQNIPQLEELYLYGNFELDKPLPFPYLKDLEVTMDDFATGINGGEISPKTITNLLSSEMPSLRSLYLDLEFDNQKATQVYALPEIFLENIKAQKMPLLLSLEIVGVFEQETREKLSAIKPLLDRQHTKLHIEDIQYPNS